MKHISDEQLRQLSDLVATSPDALIAVTPAATTRSSYRLEVVTDCELALAADSAILSKGANDQLREAARARCAEVLDALRSST